VPSPAFIHTGRFQGVGIPTVNRAHPVARNLVGCYAPGAFPSVTIPNLASPGSGDLVNRLSATKLGNTEEGLGLDIRGTAGATLAQGVAPASFLAPSNMSLFVRGLWDGGGATTNQPTIIFGVTFNTAAASSPFFSYSISPTTNNQAHVVGCAYATNSTTFLNPSFVGMLPVPTANAMLSAGAIFRGSPSVTAPALVYTNGIQFTASTSNNFGAYGAQPWVALGNIGGTTRDSGMVVTVAYLWNRALTAQEMRYLDANPYALLLWPSDLVGMALATASAGTALTADAVRSVEFLGNLLSNVAIPVESLGTGSSAVTEDATLPLEFLATFRRDGGAGAERSIIRRFSHPVLVGRVRRLFFPGRSGTIAIESEGRQRADPGGPIEALVAGGSSVVGDATSPIETLSIERSELGEVIENTASLQVYPGVPTEVLAASLLDISGPVEALAGGITTITDANLSIEWVRAAPSILVSLESGPERVRLLATRGRVRLLRRK
jgi:hypothetical protein